MKYYVCSDIHAHYGKYKKALSLLKDGDKLYVIGDVVDKGPDGLKVLLDIISNPQVELILGNHDLMFLAYIHCIFNKANPFCKSELNMLKTDWLGYNGGNDTLKAFLSLSEEMQSAVYNFLGSCYILKTVQIGLKKFTLVHAWTDTSKPIHVSDILNNKTNTYDYNSEYVWGRQETHFGDPFHYVITGHTPVCFKKAHLFANDVSKTKWKIYRNNNFFDIDCCLGVFGQSANIGVICLNNLKEYYF